MKNKNKLALALALAFATFAAQATPATVSDMDIRIGSSNRAEGATSPITLTPLAGVVAPPASPVPRNAVVPPPVAPSSSRPAIAAAANIQTTDVPVRSVAAAPAQAIASVKHPVAPEKTVAPAVRHAESPSQSATARVVPVPVAAIIPYVAPQPATPNEDTNPFTGRELSTEQRQRLLENARMDTDLIQEKLKQANLIADLTYLPLKKRAEISTLPGVAREASTTPSAKSVVETPAPLARVVKKVKPKPQKSETPTPAATPTPLVITVSGISINGTKASAILESKDGVISAQNGEMTPYGRLRVIDSRSISVGDKMLTVRDATLSRMTVSDPDPEKTKAAPAAPAPPPLLVNIAPPKLPPLPPLPKGM